MIELAETLMLFMDLQTLEDKELKKLSFSHIVHSIRQMNTKHKNDAKNHALQSILFSLLQEEHESKAKNALSAEKLFSRLQTCNERFEVKMMIIKVIASSSPGLS